MHAQTISLAEIINRGINAIQETGHTAPEPAPSSPNRTLNQESMEHRRNSTVNSRDTAKILDSADRLIRKIQTLSTVSEDPHVLRRHILYSVERFLQDITASR